jgi:hypothetical protein
MGLIAAAVAGSAVIGAGASIYGSSQSAAAAKSAAALQMQQYQTTRGDLAPYNQAGQSVLGDLTSLAQSGVNGGGTNYLQMAQDNLPGQMTEAQLQATPGYQFQLQQGLESTQNAAAARGLGVSGAALKGAATFATGLADSNYQNQFNNAQTKYSDILGLNTTQQGNLTNQYNRLSGVASLGENAAAQTGNAGTQAANSAGNALIASGNATAAGTTGASNALTGAANNYLSYNLLNSALNGTTGGYPSTVGVAGVNQGMGSGGGPA